MGSSRYGRPDHVLTHCDGPDTATATATANETEESSGVENEDPDRPSFSLVTGKYRQARRFGVRGTTLLSVSVPWPVPSIDPGHRLSL